jgi:hypothetical protein
MARVRATIVHDQTGRIISVARPSKDAKVIVLSGDGHSAMETEIDEETAEDLVGGGYRVNIEQKSLVTHA